MSGVKAEAVDPIIAAICAVMAEVGAIEKRGRNEFHRYDYATAADLAHKLQPIMAKHGLVVFQTEASRYLMAGDSVMAVEYDFVLAHKSGAVWPDRPRFTGLAAARNMKGGTDDKCVNKCHTAARKYFLIGLFQIPTGDYDDADAQEDRPSDQPEPIKPGKAVIPPPPTPAEMEARKLFVDLKEAATHMEPDDLREWADVERERIESLPEKGRNAIWKIIEERAPAEYEPEAVKFMRAG